MKKYILGFIVGSALVVSATAISEDKIDLQSFQTPCVSFDYLKKVTEDFDELPILRGDSARKDGEETVSHVTVLYMNMETKSWTLAEKMSDTSYCIISVGAGLEPVSQEIRNSIKKDRKDKKL